MKKMLYTVLAMIFLLGNGSMVMAVESEDEGVLVEPIADINVVNAKIESEKDGEFKISCNVVNNLSAQGNLLMKVQIMKIGENNSKAMVESFVAGEAFTAPKGVIEKTIDYKAPGYLKGDFDVLLSVVNEGGMMYSMLNAGKITLIGSEQFVFIDPSKCHLTVDGDKEQKKYPLSLGVDVDKNEVLRGNCFIQNTFTSDVNARVAFVQRWRSDLGKEVGKSSDENIAFGPNEGKEVSVVIPTVKEPQAYNAVMTLIDEKGKKISNEISFHYVMRGVSATIQQVQHNIDGEKLDVSFEWTPSADSHFQTRSGNASGGSYFGVVTITDKKGSVCVQSESKSLSAQDVKKEKIALNIPSKCKDKKIALKITDKDGSVLDERTLSKDALVDVNDANAGGSMTQNAENGKMQSFFVNLFKIIGIFGMCALIGGLGWRFWRRKNVMSILFLFGFFMTIPSVDAVSFYHQYCDQPSHCITLTASSSLNKTDPETGIATYNRGETMILTTVVADSRCNDGSFVPAKVSFKVFGRTVNEDTDSDNDGAADLGEGMLGQPLLMTAVVPIDQAPGSYAAKVCAKFNYGADSSTCVSIPFEVKVENGVCNTTAVGNYKWNTSNFRSTPLCESGTQAPAAVSFPQDKTQTSTVSWNCNGIGAGATSQSCAATYLRAEAKCSSVDTTNGSAYFAVKPTSANGCFEDCAATFANPSYDASGQWHWDCTHSANPATPKTIACSAKSCLSTQPFSLQRYVYFDSNGSLGDAKIDGITCAGVCCKIDGQDLNGDNSGTSLCAGQSGFVDINPGRNEFTAQCWYDEGAPGINDGEQTVPFTPLVVSSMCASHTCSAQGTCQATPKEAIDTNACTNSCTSDADCSSGKLIEDRP